MNNRRSFFKSLALISGAAVGCPGIFIPKFEPVRWKVQPKYLPCGFAAYDIPKPLIFCINPHGGDVRDLVLAWKAQEDYVWIERLSRKI